MAKNGTEKKDAGKKSTTVVVKSRLVKVIPNFTGKRKYGKEWFDFKKGEGISIPVEYRDMLANANVLLKS